MKKEYLRTLRENLNQSMKRLLSKNPSLLDGKEKPDLILAAEDVNFELVEELAKLAPFGCENPQPLVRISVKPTALRRMGNKGQYTKFTGILDNGKEISAVIFKNASAYDEMLKKGRRIDVTGTLDSQSWNGRRYLQITVLDAEE